MADLSITNSAGITPTESFSENYSTKNVQSDNSSFKQLLSCLLLSSMGQASEDSGDIASVISPLMLLLEQMQSGQFNSSEAGSMASGLSSSFSGVTTGEILKDCTFPVQGYKTQDFKKGHNGLDFSVPVGTPVRSTMEGKVVFAGMSTAGYGNLVVVQNGNYKTYYGHLSEIPVSLDQTIRRGEVIGLSGNTGKSSGPHVHYEVRCNNIPFDPRNFDGSALI